MTDVHFTSVHEHVLVEAVSSSPVSESVEWPTNVHHLQRFGAHVYGSWKVSTLQTCDVRPLRIDCSFGLQAEHEAPVTSIAVSQDGLHIVLGTEAGSIGKLALLTQAYKPLVTSHADTVHAVAVHPNRYLTGSMQNLQVQHWEHAFQAPWIYTAMQAMSPMRHMLIGLPLFHTAADALAQMACDQEFAISIALVSRMLFL